MSFGKERFTLDDVMQSIGVTFMDGCEPFITYDPTLKPQYRIIRQQSHDGTQMFTSQMLAQAMEPLLCGTSYYKPEPPEAGMVPRYTVGKIKLAIAYGRVKLPAGEYPGQRERITIPVRVEWVRQDRASAQAAATQDSANAGAERGGS